VVCTWNDEGRKPHHDQSLAPRLCWPYFKIVHRDPFISRVKLIAESWDVREGGYEVGNFPVLWAEWNGRFRLLEG